MLTEFALLVPGFFVVLMGGLTVGDALSAYNKMQNVATTVGIMTSRIKVISNEDMVGIASAARGHMFPFGSNDLSILVAAVWVDSAGTPTIQWCERWNPARSKGGTCSGSVVVGDDSYGFWETGTNLTLTDLKIPPGILNPNTGIMLAYATYDWTAPYLMIPSLTVLKMQDQFYYAPRADVSLAPPTRDRDSPRPSSSYKVRGG